MVAVLDIQSPSRDICQSYPTDYVIVSTEPTVTKWAYDQRIDLSQRGRSRLTRSCKCFDSPIFQHGSRPTHLCNIRCDFVPFLLILSLANYTPAPLPPPSALSLPSPPVYPFNSHPFRSSKLTPYPSPPRSLPPSGIKAIRSRLSAPEAVAPASRRHRSSASLANSATARRCSCTMARGWASRGGWRSLRWIRRYRLRDIR